MNPHPANDQHNLADAVLRAQAGMTAKHTPGPWTADDKGLIKDASGTLIAQVYDNPDSGLDPIGEEQSAFNMALISTAPCLLAAARNKISAACEDRRAQRSEPPPLEVVRLPAAPIIAMLFGLLVSSAFLGWGLVRLIQFFSK